MAASLLLLTPEQVQHNKALFERAPAKLPPNFSPPSRKEVPVLSVSASDTASALSVAHGTVKSGYPPPPNDTIFSNPEFHENVISTFFTTAMQAVDFVPNSPIQTPEEQAVNFDKLLRELLNYGSYLPLEYSKSDVYEHNSSDCQPLLNTISGFISGVETIMGAKNALEVAKGITDMITTAIASIGSSSSERVEKTLYSVYRVNGDVVGKPYPVGTIFWTSVIMERHVNGKSTVEKQKVDLKSYSYMILSPVVVANANALASAAPVDVKSFLNNVNQNVPGQ